MPNDLTTKLLVRKKPLTKQDWIDLLDERWRSDVHPIIEHLAQEPLKALCNSDTFFRKSNAGARGLIDREYHQRLYSVNDTPTRCNLPTHRVLYYWGIVRSFYDGWTVVSIYYHHPNGNDMVGRSVECDTEYFNCARDFLEYVASIGAPWQPLDIWNFLSVSIKHWALAKEQLAYKASEIRERVKWYDHMIDAMQK